MDWLRRVWDRLRSMPGWVYAALAAAVATALAIASRSARFRWLAKIRTLELDADRDKEIADARADAAAKQNELDTGHAAELARLEVASRIIVDATSLEDVAALLNKTMDDS